MSILENNSKAFSNFFCTQNRTHLFEKIIFFTWKQFPELCPWRRRDLQFWWFPEVVATDPETKSMRWQKTEPDSSKMFSSLFVRITIPPNFFKFHFPTTNCNFNFRTKIGLNRYETHFRDFFLQSLNYFISLHLKS